MFVSDEGAVDLEHVYGRHRFITGAASMLNCLALPVVCLHA